MARPTKQGLDEWLIRTDFLQGKKMRKLIKATGNIAPVVIICLHGIIFSDLGYFMCWDKNYCFLVAGEVGLNTKEVNKIVNKAVSIGFFDKEMFQKHKILTSIDIQKYFLTASRRRKQVSMLENYRLIDNREFIIDNGQLTIDNFQQSFNPPLSPLMNGVNQPPPVCELQMTVTDDRYINPPYPPLQSGAAGGN